MTNTDIHAMLGFTDIIGTAIEKIRDIYCLNGLPPEHDMAKFLNDMEEQNNLLATSLYLQPIDISCGQNETETGKP